MKKNIATERIQTERREECIFYMQFMKNSGCKLIKEKNKFNHIRGDEKTFTHITTEPTITLCEIINNSLDEAFETQEARNEFIKIMMESLKLFHVNEGHIKPLIANTRIMNFSWLYLRALMKKSAKIEIIKNVMFQEGLLLYPTSSKDGLDVMLSMINSLELAFKNKFNIINLIIDLYSYQLANFTDPFKWIDKKNTSEIILTHKLLVKKINETGITEWNALLIRESEKIKTHNPYLALIGLFDSWEIDTKRKENALIKINKAWHQGKFREKAKHKRVALNTYISNECKERLLMLKDKKSLSISEMIELLIDNQHYKEFGI